MSDATLSAPRPGSSTWRIARRVLFELTSAVDVAPGDTEVRVRDVDGDGELEITVMAPVERPQAYSMASAEGRVGYVLAWDDLHVQFRTSREYSSELGDAGPNTLTVTTTWRATDIDGDGHADLRVREAREHIDDDTPWLGLGTRNAGTRTVECLWRAGTDTWVCPEALGMEIFEGP